MNAQSTHERISVGNKYKSRVDSFTCQDDFYGISSKFITPLKVGDKITVKHSDGVIITETISKVELWEREFYFTCDSAACYTSCDLAKYELN